MPSVLWHCWLGSRKSIRPVEQLRGRVLAWLSVWSKVQTCIWPSWCHCHSLSLASVKSRLVLAYRLTQVVMDKGSLNVCVFVCSWRNPAVHDAKNLYNKTYGEITSLYCAYRSRVPYILFSMSECPFQWLCDSKMHSQYNINTQYYMIKHSIKHSIIFNKACNVDCLHYVLYDTEDNTSNQQNDKDTGFAVALWVEHNLRSSIPSCGNIFREEASVVVVWISNPRQTKVAYLAPYNCNQHFTTNVSINQSIDHSIDRSIHPSINQSIK